MQEGDFKDDYTTGAAKIRKQTVQSDWRGRIRKQNIEMEASKNNQEIEIIKGGYSLYRGK